MRYEARRGFEWHWTATLLIGGGVCATAANVIAHAEDASAVRLALRDVQLDWGAFEPRFKVLDLVFYREAFERACVLWELTDTQRAEAERLYLGYRGTVSALDQTTHDLAMDAGWREHIQLVNVYLEQSERAWTIAQIPVDEGGGSREEVGAPAPPDPAALALLHEAYERHLVRGRMEAEVLLEALLDQYVGFLTPEQADRTPDVWRLIRRTSIWRVPKNAVWADFARPFMLDELVTDMLQKLDGFSPIRPNDGRLAKSSGTERFREEVNALLADYYVVLDRASLEMLQQNRTWIAEVDIERRLKDRRRILGSWYEATRATADRMAALIAEIYGPEKAIKWEDMFLAHVCPSLWVEWLPDKLPEWIARDPERFDEQLLAADHWYQQYRDVIRPLRVSATNLGAQAVQIHGTTEGYEPAQRAFAAAESRLCEAIAAFVGSFRAMLSETQRSRLDDAIRRGPLSSPNLMKPQLITLP
jgi:hypothetical protein